MRHLSPLRHLRHFYHIWIVFSVIRAGFCPYHSCPENGLMNDECFTDNNCALNKKCCQTRCGNKCLQPSMSGKYKHSNPELSLREKCRNTEFFLVRIFPHSNWIRRDTSYLSVFCSIAEKYGPEKTPYFDTFHTVYFREKIILNDRHIAEKIIIKNILFG